MKHLLLFFLFSGSLDSFSQVVDTTQPLRQFDASKLGQPVDTVPAGIDLKAQGWIVNKAPDTLRAILLVTLGYRQHGIAHARMGFVVISEGKRPVYLDCRKKALKPPQVGWGYEVVGGERK